MPRRSVLFTPGDRPGRLRTAPTTGADVVVFDLEDGVAPDAKADAREAVAAVLGDPAFDPDCEVCLRVNPVGLAAAADLEAVAGAARRLDAVLLPKPEGADDVAQLDRLLAEHDRRVPVFALVESAAGLLAAAEIAAAEPVAAVAFGAEDYAADVGANRTDAETEVLYAREHVVAAAAAAGVDAIDTIYSDIGDLDGLRVATRRAVDLGFDGKMCIHPDQVDPINGSFTPPGADVEWARRVLAAARTAERGVFTVDGEMIDAPLVARAERIAERAGLDVGE